MKQNEAVERTGGKDGSEMVSEPGNTEMNTVQAVRNVRWGESYMTLKFRI